MASETVTIRFCPDEVVTVAAVGASWLEVAHQAGVEIPTGCLAGSCGACTVEVTELGEIRTCIAAIPPDYPSYEVYLFVDPTW